MHGAHTALCGSQLNGPKAAETLKVENKEAYHFRPKELLGGIVACPRPPRPGCPLVSFSCRPRVHVSSRVVLDALLQLQLHSTGGSKNKEHFS